ncbi:MAG TPA: DUF6249 domain-containing protein [Candidatus Acidoferrales bacterium]|nr:DUF6249 domain-containing protein [Candidatus Acidoferrales bacterium]
MGPDTVVPLFFFLIVVGAPIGAWIVSRVLAHQERMEMIRRGFMPPPDPRMMRRTMKYGVPPGFQPGSAPPPGFVPPAYDPEYYAQHQLRRGIQVAFIGLALLIGLSFIGYHGSGEYVWGPWLLAGLIPMFVGIAQVISAVLSGAKIGGIASGPAAAHFGPAETTEVPPASASAAAPPPPGSYGGWRPGSTPEIGKPPSPPDYR